jgi:hypothetical protein
MNRPDTSHVVFEVDPYALFQGGIPNPNGADFSTLCIASFPDASHSYSALKKHKKSRQMLLRCVTEEGCRRI